MQRREEYLPSAQIILPIAEAPATAHARSRLPDKLRKVPRIFAESTVIEIVLGTLVAPGFDGGCCVGVALC